MANIVTIDGIPVYQALVDDDETGMLRISLVDDPAVQSDFLAFSAQQRRPQLYAVQDDAKRLVLGCVMRADFPIYRRDEALKGEYYIIYKADTIRRMAEKYLAEGRQNNVNLMHQPGTDVDGVDMVQFFIKGNGIAPDGFDDIADGSLFAEFHVSNDDVWQAVKAGTYKGFSLEGLFDLAPEQSKPYIEQVVDALDGLFSKILKPTEYETMKKKGLLARLAKALVEGRNVTTDKGVLAWDSDEELAVGDSVYIEDEEGNRTPAEDGEYRTDDKVIVVEDGKVSDIRDAEVEPEPVPETEEPAAEEEAVKASEVDTDKGRILWDGEEDLREGVEVFVEDEEGNRVPAADGEYKTEDGKTIVVVDGKVAEIRDPEAEVAPETENFRRIAQAFSESYNDKFAKICEAVAKTTDNPFYLVDAGDDFAVASIWEEDAGVDKFYRYSVSWNEDGSANVSDPVEVVPAYVTPEERDRADAEFAAAKQKVADLEAEIAKMSKTPAARPAHEEVGASLQKTGVKGLDRLNQLMGR